MFALRCQSGGLGGQPLHPVDVWTHAPRRAVVPVNADHMDEAGADERLLYIRIEVCHAHLDVDDIFGCQPGHGGRADMVDAQSQAAKRSTQQPAQREEFITPALLVG